MAYDLDLVVLEKQIRQPSQTEPTTHAHYMQTELEVLRRACD